MDLVQKAINKSGLDYQLNADLSPKFVVGYVETKEKHPDADKLSVLKVNVGNEHLQIVCVHQMLRQAKRWLSQK